MRGYIQNFCFRPKRDLTVDNQYLCLVLSQISVQLNKHYANLSYAIQRKDVDLCYIKLRPATICLADCLKSLEKEIEHVESQVSYLQFI